MGSPSLHLNVFFWQNYYRNGDIDDLMIHGPYGGALPRDLAIFYTAELVSKPMRTANVTAHILLL